MFYLDNNLEKIKEKILEDTSKKIDDIDLSDDKVVLSFSDSTVLEIKYVEHEGLNIKAFRN